jgi:AmiR/NasT family two-component response regulator
VIGGLNLYSLQRHAYDEDDMITAHIYATHAAAAIRTSQDLDGMRIAVRTRHLIGMAQGMLMTRLDIDEEQSFQFLRRVSQQQNIKLRDIAAAIVEHRGSLGALPFTGTEGTGSTAEPT